MDRENKKVGLIGEFWGLLRQIYDSPHNDEKVERLYFLQKQKVAKTFIRIFDLFFY